MRYRSMRNPQYARTVRNRFRDSRPLGRHVLPPKAPETTADREDAARQLGDALLAEYNRSCRRYRARTSPEDHPQPPGASIMIKLNVGVSRKVGEPNYSSRGASVNVELELESSAAQDAHVLHDRIRHLFAVARDAVAEELGLSTQAGGSAAVQPPVPNGNGSVRPASEARVRAINAICSRPGLDPHAEAHRRLGRGRTGSPARRRSRTGNDPGGLAIPSGREPAGH